MNFSKLSAGIRKCRCLLFTLSCYAVLIAACKNPEKSMVDKQLVADSDMIISATVAVVHSALSFTDDAENSMVVTVNEVFNAPPGTDLQQGDQLTLRVKNINAYKKGDTRVFYAQTDAIGENISATETGSSPMPETKDAGSQLGQSISKAQDENFTDRLNDRISKAALAVTGKVKTIKPLLTKNEKESEHDPEREITEIEISENVKGKADKTVFILYPGSNDVAFRNYPKLETGKEWLYILDASDIKEAPFKITDPGSIVPIERFTA